MWRRTNELKWKTHAHFAAKRSLTETAHRHHHHLSTVHARNCVAACIYRRAKCIDVDVRTITLTVLSWRFDAERARTIHKLREMDLCVRQLLIASRNVPMLNVASRLHHSGKQINLNSWRRYREFASSFNGSVLRAHNWTCRYRFHQIDYSLVSLSNDIYFSRIYQ